MPSFRRGGRLRPPRPWPRGTARCAVGVVGVDRHRRVVHRAVARSSASDMSASLCWMAWNEPIGTSNCYALLRVRERHVEEPARGADELGRERHVGACRASRRRRPSVARRAASGDVDLEDATRQVDRADDAQLRRSAASTTAERRPAPTTASRVDAVGLEHERLRRLVVRSQSRRRRRASTVPVRRTSRQRVRAAVRVAQERPRRGDVAASPRGTRTGRRAARARARRTRGAPTTGRHAAGRRCARAPVPAGTRFVSSARAVSRSSSCSSVSVKSIAQPPREPEDALGDDVALDLGRSARDRVGEADRRTRATNRPFSAPRSGSMTAPNGARDLHAELVQRLAQLGRRQLHVAVLGRRPALRERSEPLVPERPQARRPARTPRRSAPDDRVAGRARTLAPARRGRRPLC